MLVITPTIKTPSVDRLVKLWSERYTVDLSSLPLFQDPLSYRELVEAASSAGRVSTASKLHDNFVVNYCQMASIQAKALYEYIPNIVDLKEAKRLTEFAYHVYMKLLEIYQQPLLTATSAKTKPFVVPERESPEVVALSTWGIPAIEQLAKALEPVLLEFQEQHVASKDWRTLGFITTLLNFSNQLLLHKLTPVERVLLNPYLQFVEEQVAVPWQRVCYAAAKHTLGSPALKLVEQMLPAAQEIAQTVYHRLTQLFPNHRSRRGGLREPRVAHSCVRDLNMFQAYLWLCVLEESMTSVEEELVSLCVMVMASVEVKWEMTEQWSQLLADEIIRRLNPQEKFLLLPYTQGMQEAFVKRRMHLGATESQ